MRVHQYWSQISSADLTSTSTLMLLTTTNGPIATDSLIGKLRVRFDTLSNLLGHRIHRCCSSISSADLTSTSMLLTTSNGPIGTDTLISKQCVHPDLSSEWLGYCIRQYWSTISSADLTSTSMLLTTTNGLISTDNLIGKLKGLDPRWRSIKSTSNTHIKPSNVS